MSELKITGYADSVSALPDNPSDAGFTPAELKRIFDSRTDNEVKDKHNKTVDALLALSERVGGLDERQEELLALIEKAVTEDQLNAILDEIALVLQGVIDYGEEMLKEE